MNKSYLTAIKRKKLSAPMAWLKQKGLLKKGFLDYGCGRGSDADLIADPSCMVSKYDPHYFPVKPKGKFDLFMGSR